MTYRKKLIEVALPLEEINLASAREKSIRHGHPSTLHLWWARRPLATCRAVLFSSIIDDPGEEGVPQELLEQIDALPLDHKYRHLAQEEPRGSDGSALEGDESAKEKLARQRRYRLFTFIERLVLWENSNDPETLKIARDLIMAATGGNPPPVLDPFCGGGSIPLEAQRLGLEAYGSDLNPVAVLITKAMIELPPKFAGQPPVNPPARANLGLKDPKPPATTDFETINLLGHCFKVREAFGGKDAVELQDMALAMAEDWRRQQRWSGSLDELRGALLYFLREQRHNGSPPESGSERADLFFSLYNTIRETWDSGVQTQSTSLPMDVSFTGAQGLAEDVRYYGQWMRDEAEKRIGHLYPKVKAFLDPNNGQYFSEDQVNELWAQESRLLDTKESLFTHPSKLIEEELTVIAWLWARTVPSPDPAAQGAHVPLVRSFVLSSRKGKETWVEPIVNMLTMTYSFQIVDKKPLVDGTYVARKGGRCVLTGAPMSLDYLRSQMSSKHRGQRLLAVVAEGVRGRVYLSPTESQERTARTNEEFWSPSQAMPNNPRWFSPPGYGLPTYGDLFTNRQLVALTTFSDLVGEARDRVRTDALIAGKDEAQATAYANAISTYLAFVVDKGANLWSSITSWMSDRGALRETFARQAIPMVWDFAEANPFSSSGGSIDLFLKRGADAVENAAFRLSGRAHQADATKGSERAYLFSTDPPYFDNIGYADLSDFFYVWLRRSLSTVYPELFSTVVTPKTDELIATPYRHEGSKERATHFFEKGLRQVFGRMRDQGLPEFPTTIYYAFKQSETEESEDEGSGSVTASTGWESMLQGLVDTGFAVNGTWPTRESAGRLIAKDTNALGSCIVLVCRQREAKAETIHRRQFLSLLRQELKPALIKLTQGNIAPVDLAQAAIGPGMAVFSRYKAVLEADGSPMRVRTALTLINQALDEALAEQEGWYDPQTRWAVTWFHQRSFQEGPYGEAETLATAKDAPVSTMVEAGIVRSGGGKVKLLSRDELPADYDPKNDPRTTIWEATQYLVRELENNGEQGAARLMRRFRETKPNLDVDRVRELAYRLYAICDQKKWLNEARGYNALVLTWTDIETVSQTDGAAWGAGSDSKSRKAQMEPTLDL